MHCLLSSWVYLVVLEEGLEAISQELILKKYAMLEEKRKNTPKLGEVLPSLSSFLKRWMWRGLLWIGFKRRASVRTDGVVGGIWQAVWLLWQISFPGLSFLIYEMWWLNKMNNKVFCSCCIKYSKIFFLGIRIKVQYKRGDILRKQGKKIANIWGLSLD